MGALRSPGVAAFLLGAVSVAGYAPFGIFPLPVVTLALLYTLWHRAATPRAAAGTGFAYGMGQFLCGVSWVYVSLHEFGAMPAPLAAAATVGFCAVLALMPALAGWLYARLPGAGCARFAAGAPALWTLAEWTRGWIFTGFPWLALGYSQVPASPLAGYAPVLGIFGVGLAAACTAGLACCAWQQATAAGAPAPRSRVLAFLRQPAAIAIAVTWTAGWGLAQVAWTRPAGEPVTVSLVQGNVPQEMKWRADTLRRTLDAYLELVRSAPGRLVVLPETALPLYLDQVPADYLEALAAPVRARGGDVLVGIPEREPGGAYYNSVVTLGAAPQQRYRKSHLVPFGEFIPLRPVLGGIVGALAIPLQDFSRGETHQQPLAVAGQRVAADICYEDAFGEEIIRQLPAATLLVNVSNVAWFGRSLAPRQHLQISQARALESGRYMLRATNTGVTAVIDPRGRVAARAPEFTTAILTHTVHGYEGATPYVRWGNHPVLALCVLALAAAFAARARARA